MNGQQPEQPQSQSKRQSLPRFGSLLSSRNIDSIGPKRRSPEPRIMARVGYM
jgi:hypothetical protein